MADENKIKFPEPKSDRDAYIVENSHVHQIYDKIALHFDSTRYKTWPIIEKFLLELNTGLIGIDVGCGNGKYLGVNKNVHLIGSDICSNFAKISNEKGFEALIADGLLLPYKSDTFDFAISIAVIHHFSTFERRVDALREVVRTLKPGGIFLVTAWSITQKWRGKNYDHQDVMVPWLLQGQFSTSKKENENNNNNKNSTTTDSNNNSENSNTNSSSGGNITEKGGTKYEVYHRYYHLFEDGEFERLFKEIPGCEIIKNDLDHDNYNCFVRKK
ncbi:putative Generic methyl-transferase/SAM [Tieghemostelium lacteum]|uniref:Putative Generic methyl-transferase/SAM n=1 Tax=Tieghemostelium lacteum TaxID=361077 RepID=A0A152A998_TIELA|nr:putative Generic methyl-transferase/SAM [Tieghemostelium lacteum]|eukprot:KYR02802.1 putative Generic methyl-transferase/SAM [Tieghemostelium lacteum]